MEFEARFPDEITCRDYLFDLRWPDGFICPRCQHGKAWAVSRTLFQCAGCDYQVSVTAGTIFQDTHKPLTLWFRAIWWVVTQKNGASALGLQNVLGLGSYQTAWAWLHKIRRAMVRPSRDRLSGRVEVDETYVGGPEKGVAGRETQKKALIVIAAEENGAGIGRIRMRRLPNASGQSLVSFLIDSVEPCSVIHTDGWQAYGDMKTKGYVHEVTKLMHESESGVELMPRVHRVAALLKRWLMGTHHGAVSPEHLDYYLDEFTFRFNRRTSRSRGKLFFRLMQHAVTVEPIPYKDMIKGIRGREKGKPQDVVPT